MEKTIDDLKQQQIEFVMEVFFNYEITSDQIKEIRLGFQAGLTIEQIKIYAKSELSWEQMRQIRLAFKAGLTIEQIKICAKSEFSPDQMNQICTILSNPAYKSSRIWRSMKAQFIWVSNNTLVLRDMHFKEKQLV